MRNWKKAFGAILIVVIVSALTMGLLVVGKHTMEHQGLSGEATFSFFNMVVTIAATILVVLQLYESRKVKCCDMMSQMNIGFLENPRMMRLYHELECCYRDETHDITIYDEEQDGNDPNHVHQPDMVAYLTFYECMYSYLKSGIISISELDDYFGDRFFKLVHNRYVQEHELYAVPSSYANIFELYKLWYGYRESHKTALVAGNAYQIPPIYIQKRLYMEEVMFQELEQTEVQLTGKRGSLKLTYRRLFPSMIDKVLSLQDDIAEDLKKAGREEYLVLSTKEEILESMLVDYCFGLFDGDRLVAFCITVLNRRTDRNLATLIQKRKEYEDYVTVDSVQAAADYRGYGIQAFFLQKSQEVSQKCGAKHMIATVSLNNDPSRRNFLDFGFEVYGEPIVITGGQYRGARRNLFVKTL